MADERDAVIRILAALDRVVEVVDVEDRTLADVVRTDAKFVDAANAFLAEFEAAYGGEDWRLKLVTFEDECRKAGYKDRAAAARLIREFLTSQQASQN